MPTHSVCPMPGVEYICACTRYARRQDTNPMPDPNEPGFFECCAEYNGVGGCRNFCCMLFCPCVEFGQLCHDTPSSEYCWQYTICSAIPFGQYFCNLFLYHGINMDLKEKFPANFHYETSCSQGCGMAFCTPCLLVAMQRKVRQCHYPITVEGTSCTCEDIQQSNTMYTGTC